MDAKGPETDFTPETKLLTIATRSTTATIFLVYVTPVVTDLPSQTSITIKHRDSQS